MTRGLIVHRAGPGMAIQDLGRSGFLAQGLSCGGAADLAALAEGAALLGQTVDCAALEIAGYGGVFEATEDIWIALTGAPMRADIDGTTAVWGASHFLGSGAKLTLGAVTQGVYGYLNVAGGFATPQIMGSRATHLTAGIGGLVSQGDILPVGPDSQNRTQSILGEHDRFGGGTVRFVPSAQTNDFEATDVARFQNTTFMRGQRGNRQGVQLEHNGPNFGAKGQLSRLSEAIVVGDIQMTGDGSPFVLLAECQTTGGYPRIGTVIPADLPIVAQAASGAALKFRMISIDDAVATLQTPVEMMRNIRARMRPLRRDPMEMSSGELLALNLVSGMINAME